MTLLSVVQDACSEIGLSEPSTVISNTDPTVMQLLALANRGGKALAQRFPWEESIREFTHTALAAELQGTVESIMPGFNWLVYESLWNRTLQNPVEGPLYPDEWQYLKASSVTGPYSQFRIRQKNLYMIPAPTAGDSVAGEYHSRYWCQSSGSAAQERWAADDDTGLLSEDLLTLDLVWRWNRAKRLDYAEEKMEFEIQVNNAMSRSGASRVMNLGGGELLAEDFPSGIAIPPGSWSL